MSEWYSKHTKKDLADRIVELAALLATCEKYRDAYAECDRIATQAVRDLEARLEKAEAERDEARKANREMLLEVLAASGQAQEAYGAQLAVEARLIDALGRGFWAGRACGGSKADIDAALAQLKDTK